ncbi:three-Cys-motif partner protein TcmP [Danxiaibacter flavus]|uniref:Three-Cys-motif partner protein TcmP n=1 Tax=Danxiaibacter flavus TaxID=3049108 RepID=A0ABV3ZBC9_9BACT|nr:three-Cys-motif partner protein TcmP [Chitinophagaceae bacterium DXS]
MTWNKNVLKEPPGNEWGGTWTHKKLQAFSKYVWAYLAIMKKYNYWQTIYFDGFAGSGTRNKETKTELYKQLSLTEDEENLYKGAAELILNTSIEHQFDFYYFIDLNESSLEKLKATLQKLDAAKNKKLVFKPGDSNQWIKELATVMKTHPSKYASLILLDPFGMQINWESIAALKDTRSDVWILVPTGVIVNRLLDKAGKLTHLDKLQSFFGLNEEEIRSRFYKKEHKQTLFGDEEVVEKVSRPIELIAEIYIERLKTIWKEVTDKPLVLKNSMNTPIFHFVFASNNKNAVKIAKDIIKSI